MLYAHFHSSHISFKTGACIARRMYEVDTFVLINHYLCVGKTRINGFCVLILACNSPDLCWRLDRSSLWLRSSGRRGLIECNDTTTKHFDLCRSQFLQRGRAEEMHVKADKEWDNANSGHSSTAALSWLILTYAVHYPRNEKLSSLLTRANYILYILFSSSSQTRWGHALLPSAS